MRRKSTTRVPLAERLWTKIDRRGPDECWPWLASKNQAGYGKIGAGGYGTTPLYAHRVVKELVDGPPPAADMVIDHLCRNPSCCNPAHLEWVTHRTNTLRGTAPMVRVYLTGRCMRGHLLTPDNVWRGAKGSRQRCRECSLALQRQRPRRRTAPPAP